MADLRNLLPDAFDVSARYLIDLDKVVMLGEEWPDMFIDATGGRTFRYPSGAHSCHWDRYDVPAGTGKYYGLSMVDTGYEREFHFCKVKLRAWAAPKTPRELLAFLSMLGFMRDRPMSNTASAYALHAIQAAKLIKLGGQTDEGK